tara:strand:+ start:795 stop:905 length:111 start_codon:yes stop_codon:yes gene_type:complete
MSEEKETQESHLANITKELEELNRNLILIAQIIRNK